MDIIELDLLELFREAIRQGFFFKELFAGLKNALGLKKSKDTLLIQDGNVEIEEVNPWE